MVLRTCEEPPPLQVVRLEQLEVSYQTGLGTAPSRFQTESVHPLRLDLFRKKSIKTGLADGPEPSLEPIDMLL